MDRSRRKGGAVEASRHPGESEGGEEEAINIPTQKINTKVK
jgi:hypothetical protein